MSFLKKIVRKLLGKALARLAGVERPRRGWQQDGRDWYPPQGRYRPRRKGSGPAGKAYKALKLLQKRRGRW